MRIADLKLDKFMAAVKGIDAALSDPEHCDQFLGTASSDTPIIEGLLEQIAVFEAFSDSKQKKACLAAAHRDLVILLAFRHIERMEDTKA